MNHWFWVLKFSSHLSAPGILRGICLLSVVYVCGSGASYTSESLPKSHSATVASWPCCSLLCPIVDLRTEIIPNFLELLVWNYPNQYMAANFGNTEWLLKRNSLSHWHEFINFINVAHGKFDWNYVMAPVLLQSWGARDSFNGDGHARQSTAIECKGMSNRQQLLLYHVWLFYVKGNMCDYGLKYGVAAWFSLSLAIYLFHD